MERIKKYLSSFDFFKKSIEKGGLHKVFDDMKIDISLEKNNSVYHIADKLCELQHDHTWIMQAVGNLVAMLRTDNTDYKPAILLGCVDNDLDVMFEDCYNSIRKMQKRIKELEEENKRLKDNAARV